MPMSSQQEPKLQPRNEPKSSVSGINQVCRQRTFSPTTVAQFSSHSNMLADVHAVAQFDKPHFSEHHLSACMWRPLAPEPPQPPLPSAPNLSEIYSALTADSASNMPDCSHGPQREAQGFMHALVSYTTTTHHAEGSMCHRELAGWRDGCHLPRWRCRLPSAFQCPAAPC